MHPDSVSNMFLAQQCCKNGKSVTNLIDCIHFYGALPTLKIDINKSERKYGDAIPFHSIPLGCEYVWFGTSCLLCRCCCCCCHFRRAYRVRDWKRKFNALMMWSIPSHLSLNIFKRSVCMFYGIFLIWLCCPFSNSFYILFIHLIFSAFFPPSLSLSLPFSHSHSHHSVPIYVIYFVTP